MPTHLKEDESKKKKQNKQKKKKKDREKVDLRWSQIRYSMLESTFKGRC